MKIDVEPLIHAGKVLLALAKRCETRGNINDARKFYFKAIRQGYLIRRLRAAHDASLNSQEQILQTWIEFS